MSEVPTAATPSTSAAELRARLAEIFQGEEIELPAHLDAVLDRHHRLPDQRPATCPAYSLSYLLPARGFTELDGTSLGAEDYVAHLAEVTIEDGEVAESVAITARVQAGEMTEAEARERNPRTWYRFPVRSSSDPAEVGASPEGVARAVALAGRGRLVTVPVPGRDAAGRPQLRPAAWEALLDAAAPAFLAGELDVLFNYEANQLLAARDPAYNAANLRRADAAAAIPRDDWGVGHYAPLGALWRRPSGERWLVLLNSFKARGFAGVEPQPAELVRRGAVREDGRGGGVLLIATRERGAELLPAIRALGLEVRTWSNGSQPPADWRWKPGL